jgi:endoglucanase
MTMKHFLALGVLMTSSANGGERTAEYWNARIGRGINLGNMLEAPRKRAWAANLTERDFQLIADAGFNSVRIPIRWSDYAGEDAPYTIDSDFFERVDWAIEQALSRGLVVIINIHHYHEFMDAPAEHRARLMGMWKQIAARYRDQPPELIFEIMNEPTKKVTAEIWNAVQNEALALIRSSNPERVIFVAPIGWNRIKDLHRLELPTDDLNLIASVHFYEPFSFTHQGARWVEMDLPVGTKWFGTDEEKAEIREDLDKAVRWSKKHGIPINIGEFGAYEKGDMESRARWTAFLCREAEARGMSFNYWELRSSFGVYDLETNTWREPLLKALIPKKD